MTQKIIERICIFSLIVMGIATYIICIDTMFALNMDDIVGVCGLLILGTGLVVVVMSYFLD